MLVRMLAVKFLMADNITVAEVFDELALEHGVGFPYGGHFRRMYVNRIGDVHVALFLTVKDQRTWMEMHEADDGSVTIEPQEVAAGRNLIDFNFLAIRDDTGKGLYQHYRGSQAVATLQNVIASRHKQVVKRRRDELIASGEGSVTARQKAARKTFDGAFSIAQMVREAELEDLLQELDEIRSFQVDIEGIADNPPTFRPLGSFVEETRYRLKFKPDLAKDQLISKVVALVHQRRPKAGRVEGRVGDESRVYDIYTHPATVIAEHDYDAVAATAFTSAGFADASILQGMLTDMASNPSMFARAADA